MYQFHNVVLKKVNEIRDEMEINLNTMRKEKNINGIVKEAHKILKLLLKKTLVHIQMIKKNHLIFSDFFMVILVILIKSSLIINLTNKSGVNFCNFKQKLYNYIHTVFF